VVTPRLDDPRFNYTPAAGTDITVNWRKNHGWIPPSEQAHYQQKWTEFQLMHLRGDGVEK